jgi:hypothetical protein
MKEYIVKNKSFGFGMVGNQVFILHPDIHLILLIGVGKHSFLQILKRKPEYDEEHGSKRLVVLFLFAYGIATCDAFFLPGWK